MDEFKRLLQPKPTGRIRSRSSRWRSMPPDRGRALVINRFSTTSLGRARYTPRRLPQIRPTRQRHRRLRSGFLMADVERRVVRISTTSFPPHSDQSAAFFYAARPASSSLASRTTSARSDVVSSARRSVRESLAVVSFAAIFLPGLAAGACLHDGGAVDCVSPDPAGTARPPELAARQGSSSRSHRHRRSPAIAS